MTHAKTHVLEFLVRLVLLSLISPLSCALWNSPQTKNTSSEQLPQYWLKTSMFAGPFWDNDRIVLVDHRPFSAIDDVQTIDGYTIYTKNSNKIITAGTLIKLLDISWPSKLNNFKRPLYSPKNNIWIYFKIAKERGEVSIFDEKIHIMIVPHYIDNEQLLKQYLANFFTLKDPNIDILNASKAIQQAIWLKQPIIGMSRENLLSALGPPSRKTPVNSDSQVKQSELWLYPNFSILIEADMVIKIDSISSKTKK